MWKLSEIHIENIISFKEASYVFNQGVATLIFGKNEDNASQPCNGSGKSSFIEAISIALTGEQLRKVKSIEEVINDEADDAYISLRLSNDYDGTQMTINRRISRNAPQCIQIIRQTGPYDTDTEEVIQPTVADYNRYILDAIGLSKDDIYNNFILCDNKYEGFFDCSDKSKKEIINRFSNGIIIDESIARVQADMVPISEKLNEANSNVISIKGSISAIEHELDGVYDKIMNARQERQRNIERLDGKIQQCSDEIKELENKQTNGYKRLRTLTRLQTEIKGLEGSNISMLDSYYEVKSICDEHNLGTISDFEQVSHDYKQQLTDQQRMIGELATKIESAEFALIECKQKYSLSEDAYKKHSDEDAHLSREETQTKALISKEIDAIDAQLDKIEASMKLNKNRQAELEAQIAHNKALLDGIVECPNCKHKFLIGQEKSVDEVKTLLSSYNSEIAEKKTQIETLTKQFVDADSRAENKSKEIQSVDISAKERSVRLVEEYNNLKTLSHEVTLAETKISDLKRQQTNTQNEIDKLTGKIDILRNRLFGEVNGILVGRILNGQQYIEQQTTSMVFAQGQLTQYQKSRQELIDAPETDFASSLKKSLDTYQTQLTVAETALAEIQAEYNVLKQQEVNFTMFKSYIARKKIDALSLIVNDFLEKIGSDIRLKLEGFTMTKTGKLRDKISVQVMRDGIDCGSYHKFSGGEKARLNLACILSLHTLTNSNCEDGKGLDFIIIDELLDKSDEVGMATYCDALNRLGQTALLITQGGVSEAYPHKLLVVKRHGVSTILQ